MELTIDPRSQTPIYLQIVEQLRQSITGGALPPKAKLPTVRQLADANNISRGTVKHAYDTLAKEGLIQTAQGSGCYVCFPTTPTQRARAEGMAALDSWIDDMLERSFSLTDIRFMMEEVYRERMHPDSNVRITAVECTPEALAVMHRQLLQIPHAEVSDYLLDAVLEAAHPFNPDADIIVTTPTHYEELLLKTNPRHRVIQLVLAVATGTALEIASIPPDTRVGIICVSRRFGDIMSRACMEYAHLVHPPEIVYMGDYEQGYRMAKECGQLILAPNYHLFESARGISLLREYRQKRRPITYQYHIEKGSLLFLEEQIHRVHEEYQRKMMEAT